MSDLEALLGFSYFPLDVVLGRSQVTHSNYELFSLRRVHIQKVLAVSQKQSLKEERLNYSTRTLHILDMGQDRGPK